MRRAITTRRQCSRATVATFLLRGRRWAAGRVEAGVGAGIGILHAGRGELAEGAAGRDDAARLDQADERIVDEVAAGIEQLREIVAVGIERERAAVAPQRDRE